MSSAPRSTPFPSRVVRVTFFEDRAEVVRSAQVTAPAGKAWVAVGGISPFVDDRSVRATPAGAGVTLLGARVVRDVTEAPREDPQEILAREEALRSARQETLASSHRLERGDADEARIRQQLHDWTRGLARVPPGLSEPSQLASWREAFQAFADAVGTAHEVRGASRAAALRADDAELLAEKRLAEARQLQPRCEARVELQLEADAETELEVELIYRTPCALWRPEHLIRLVTDSDEAPVGTLELTTYATAWHRTGEEWDDVQVAFSTARPGRVATAPTVRDDLLTSREKAPEERKRIVVAARDQQVSLAGLDRGARAADEMPGVDDGGEPLTFEAAERVSLASDGRPFRVEIDRRRLEAGVVRLALPEVAPVAHIRATATLTGETPLLAGPLRVARGRAGRQDMVGRAKLDFVAAGEPFELGFGTDDAIRVRREQEQERHRTAVTGSQRVERKVTLFLSNQSTDRKTVKLKERIPVSELAEVEVALTESEGWTHEEQDGFLTRVVELAPRDTQELSFAYEVRAGSKVSLPF